MSEQILVGIWLSGWIAATIFAAAVIGNIPNRPDDPPDFPTFLYPLFYGWLWPAVVVLAAIIAPLAWLSQRATARNTKES